MPKPPKPALDALEPERVCLIKPSALGDVVQTLPVVAGLRRRWPAATISWVVNRGFASLIEGHPDVDEVIPFDRAARGVARWRGYAEFAGRLRRGRFDLAIDLQGLLRSGLMARLTGAGRRVGFAQGREGSPRCYTDRVDVPVVLPAVIRNWRVAEALGCQGPPPASRVPMGSGEREWVAGVLAGAARPWLVIHPGAQWETKRWPTEHFAVIARRALAAHGGTVVLVGAAAEAENCAALAAALRPDVTAGRVRDLAQQTTLLQLAAVSEAADVFLAGDTGPMHLAAAVGTRVVALYTCTTPLRAAPHGEGHAVVATQVECAASYLKTCPKMICHDELSPERVWPAVHAALAAAGSTEAPRRTG